MSLMDKLQEEIKQYGNITYCDFVIENNIRYLKIEVDTPKRDIKSITKVTKIISEYMDKNEKQEKKYILDVYSPGV